MCGGVIGRRSAMYFGNYRLVEEAVDDLPSEAEWLGFVAGEPLSLPLYYRLSVKVMVHQKVLYVTERGRIGGLLSHCRRWR